MELRNDIAHLRLRCKINLDGKFNEEFSKRIRKELDKFTRVHMAINLVLSESELWNRIKS